MTLRAARRLSPMARVRLQSAVTVGFAALMLAAGWTGAVPTPWWEAQDISPAPWWHLGPLALMAGVMLLRIRRPGLALLLGAGCVLLDAGIGLAPGILLCLTDLIYNVGIRAGRRAVRTSGAALVLVTLTIAVVVLAVGVDLQSAAGLALAAGAVLLMPLWWSTEVRRGHPIWQETDTRQHLEAERHVVLLREHEQRRRAAVDAERRGMARELHDVVSSQVSAIALTSGAVLNTGPDTARDRHALQTIRSTSVEALDDLSEMVGLLRGSPGPDGSPSGQQEQPEPSDPPEASDHPLSVQPIVDTTTWESVIAHARAHGLSVSVHGDPPDQLVARVRHVALRVLQEALINALKHGAGTAEVDVGRRRRSLRLRIISGLRAGRPPSTDESVSALPERCDDSAVHDRSGTGTGLIAMRERVQLLDGRLETGADGDTWVVDVELPVRRETA